MGTSRPVALCYLGPWACFLEILFRPSMHDMTHRKKLTTNNSYSSNHEQLKPATHFLIINIKRIFCIWLVEKVTFSHNMEKVARTDSGKNNDGGNYDAVAVAVHNSALLKIPLPPLWLMVVMPYVENLQTKKHQHCLLQKY